MMSFMVPISAMYSSCYGMHMFIMTCRARGGFLISMICRYGKIVFRVGIMWIYPGNNKVL